MQGKSDGVNRMQRSFKDAETLKREELHRRRLLRLEQVRQQSKDVANLVRQKVLSEREKQLGLVQDRVNARTHQWQVRKLKELQGEYNKTVQNVGRSHADAANQPNEEAAQKEEAEKILSAAHKRGQEALFRLREEEKARRRANDERRFQLLNVRAVEEARAAAVVALPCPESTVGLRSIPQKTAVSIVVPPPKVCAPSKTSMPEWPKRLWPQQALPLGITNNQGDNDQGDTLNTENIEKNRDQGSNADLATLPVSSHGDSTQPQRFPDEPRFLQTATISNKPSSLRDSETAASNYDVKLYDYSSCFPSLYSKTPGIVEKVQPAGEINAKEAADRCMVISDSKCNPDVAHRELQRGREALQRVQAQRDYKHFMGSLSLLAKQNAALSSCGSAPEKPWIKANNEQDQLKLAVENILKVGEETPNHSSLNVDSTETPDGSLVMSRFGDTPDSAPRLNVGLWQPPDTPLEQEDSKKVVSSSSDSLILPPAVSQSMGTAHNENSARESALRSLMQRINDERHSLLLSSQQPLLVKTTQDLKKDIDVKSLEERVLQQRKQLKIQQSEVRRLGDSIVAPDCINAPMNEEELKSSLSTPSTHESIIIEHSDRSPDSSFHLHLPENFVKKKGKISVGDGSFANDALFYSMDVSMSSVVMDQTESSSSGSKSLSLHGVQVLVKVCGSEKEVSGRRSMSHFDKENGRAKVIELQGSNESQTHENKDGQKGTSSNSTEQVDKNPRKKKVKEQRRKSKENESQPLREKLEKSPVINKSSHQLLDKEKKSKPEVIANKVPKHGVMKKNQMKSRNSDGGMDKKAAEKGGGLKKEIAEGSKRDVEERTQELSQEDLEMREQLTSTSTSYLSPPDKVLSSLTEDIKTLMALAQRNIPTQSKTTNIPKNIQEEHNVPLVNYINRLLAMSRESIDRLNVSCSEVSTPSSALFKFSGAETVTDISVQDGMSSKASTKGQVSQSRNLSYDNVDGTVNLQGSINEENNRSVHHTAPDEWLLHSALTDQGALTDMTRQCHEKISALTKMIEDVRRQAVVNSSTDDSLRSADNQSRSTLHLDSTAYMSPPPHALEWADIAAPSQVRNDMDSRMSLDPYSNAVVQLLADVRSQMSSKVSELSDPHAAPFFRTSDDHSHDISGHMESNHVRPKPPVAFWRNIERCNAMSPTQPHELSTILELGTTLPESNVSYETAPASPAHGLSSPGTPPDVIAELMRRNLLTSPFAWAKKMDGTQRQSSNSSSPLKNSMDSDLSCGKVGGQSDISASRETNTVSFQSQNTSSNGSKDWKTNILMSPVDLYSSADEVEGDFRRMGIGWVGAMLRKTKEAGALSTTSSSDGTPVKKDNPTFKEVFGLPDEDPILSSSVTAPIRQGRGHSTPIKHPSDLSSTGSHLV